MSPQSATYLPLYTVAFRFAAISAAPVSSEKVRQLGDVAFEYLAFNLRFDPRVPPVFELVQVNRQMTIVDGDLGWSDSLIVHSN